MKRLLSWFRAGALVRPSADRPNFVDLVRALSGLAGADAPEQGPGVRHLRSLIGPADRCVFLLLDGLGWELLEHAPPDGFLRSHVVERLQAAFPPTTAAALTTLATGQWAATHGVPTWWSYLPEFGVTATVLPFTERFSGRPLGEFGVRAEDLYPVPSFWPRMDGTLTVIKKPLAESEFTTYQAGRGPRVDYADLNEAAQIVAESLATARPPRFIYVYVNQPDGLVHRLGTEHEDVDALLAELDAWVAGFAEAIAGRARLVVSADHGLVTIRPERRLILEPGDPLLDTLLCPPTGEPTVPILHVRPGQEGRFQALWSERLGDAFALITPDEAEELELLGPEKLSEVTRRRLGTFLGLAGEPAAVWYRPPAGELVTHIGLHAGLSPAEMWVPLITA